MLGKDSTLRVIADDTGVDEAAQVELSRAEHGHLGGEFYGGGRSGDGNW